ncbi:MAG: hypothetical protein H6Q33_455 [Deltaproteobacteria bacterium]|nr:hypothetical protein [Deltaproteobacteria bacterium]
MRIHPAWRLYLGVVTLLVAPTASATWPRIGLGPEIAAFSTPVFVANAGDGSDRLFVVQQNGIIRIVRQGAINVVPFLDITDRVSCCGERGLLSVAFPPQYAAMGHFYVYYTNGNGNLIVARYRLTADADVADAASEQIVLAIDHPTFANHNGGQLAFGPNDGYLYVGTGDGGGGGDPSGNGQNFNVLLGKLLRLDVESGSPTYRIPPTNPFVGQPGFRDEIWAVGLRNPWRFAFDRGTGGLFIGDVGQNRYEEIDFQPAASGGGQNYGWNIMEGFHCYNTPSCATTGLTLPVTEYDHSQGDCAVIGGYVYRGTMFPGLQGIYLLADNCSGLIRALRQTLGGWQTAVILNAGFQITGMGEDEAGEIYVTDYTHGAIRHIVQRVCAGDCNDDGTVAVDEILGAATIALGDADVSACSAGDANHDRQITVDEIVRAVASALGGCP